MRKIAIVFCLLLAGFLWSLPAAEAQSREVKIVEVDAPVTQLLIDYFQRVLAEAEREGSEAVVVVLNTPGGDVSVTLEIVQIFRNSNVPIIVYVGPSGAQAASAGSIITMAAHASGMAPETVIGAASPVDGSGGDLGDTMQRKMIEDLKATARSLTEYRGAEAVTLAEEMIEDARAVHANEALNAGLIDVVATDIDHLLTQLDGKIVTVNNEEVRLQTANAQQDDRPMHMIERLLLLMTEPIIISTLFILGIMGIITEVATPGGWIAGFVGVVSLGLALYGAGQLPVNWLGLGLMGVAFVLFILEAKAATHGVLGAVGALTLLGGLLMLFNSPSSPEFMHLSIPAAVILSVATAGLFVFLAMKALQAHKEKPVTGNDGMIGQTGYVKSDLAADVDKRYRGSVRVFGEIWRAQAEEALPAGTPIEVVDIDKFTLHVKKRV